MTIDGESIKRLIHFLQAKLTVENNSNKDTYISQFKPIRERTFKYLCELVNQHLDATPRVNITFFKTSLDEAYAERTSLDMAIRESIFQISGYVAVLDCALSFYQEAINDSVVHTYLVSLALMQMFQFSTAPLFEIVQVCNGQAKYAVILFNRDRSVPIEDIEKWGNDCSVIDSYHQCYGEWSSFHAGSYILKDKIMQGAQLTVLVANDFNLNSLLKLSNPSYLHWHQESARACLHDYFTNTLKYYISQFSLPALTPLCNSSPAVLEDEDESTLNFVM